MENTIEEPKEFQVAQARSHQADEAAALGIDASKIKRTSVSDENDAFEGVSEELENLNGVVNAFHFDENDPKFWKIKDYTSAAYLPWRVPGEFVSGQSGNPNIQAPREAKLLVQSILRSSFTMCITAVPALLTEKDKHPQPYTLKEIQEEFSDFGFAGDSSLMTEEERKALQLEHHLEILKYRNGWEKPFAQNSSVPATLENLAQLETLGDGPRIKMVQVIDGFHRKISLHLSAKLFYREQGYLPCAFVFQSPDERLASVVQFNRARGSHQLDVMADLVVELKRRRWSDEKIQKQLGMEMEEIYRLQRTTGIASLFTDSEFNEDWELSMVADLKKDAETEHIDNSNVGQMKEMGRGATLDKMQSKEMAASTAAMMG